VNRMRLIGQKYKKCECCCKHEYAYYFEWYSIVTEDYLGTICFKCARRELFGSKYKYNRNYESWLKTIEKE